MSVLQKIALMPLPYDFDPNYEERVYREQIQSRIAPRENKIEITCGEKLLGIWDQGWFGLCGDCKLKGEHQEGCTNKVTIDLGPKY